MQATPSTSTATSVNNLVLPTVYKFEYRKVQVVFELNSKQNPPYFYCIEPGSHLPGRSEKDIDKIYQSTSTGNLLCGYCVKEWEKSELSNSKPDTYIIQGKEVAKSEHELANTEASKAQIAGSYFGDNFQTRIIKNIKGRISHGFEEGNDAPFCTEDVLVSKIEEHFVSCSKLSTGERQYMLHMAECENTKLELENQRIKAEKQLLDFKNQILTKRLEYNNQVVNNNQSQGLDQSAMVTRDVMDENLARITTKIENLEMQLRQNFSQRVAPIEYSRSIPTNGVLIWRLTDFAIKRQEAINGTQLAIYSPPFYSSQYGYKMCVRIYLNGDGFGKATHISLFFVVMKGDYDALIPWPFQKKITMMILDQDNGDHMTDAFRSDPDSISFHRPRNNMNIASGSPLFLPLETLENRGYVKGDVMFIKVIVD